MSLWCGACRNEIFEGFGLLYRMEMVGGKPRFPTKDQEYVPPNSAVCDRCWKGVPRKERLTDASAATGPNKRFVFAYADSDSSNSPIWGSKQWSDIEASENYVYLRLAAVQRYLPQTLPIIVSDAKSKKASRAARIGVRTRS